MKKIIGFINLVFLIISVSVTIGFLCVTRCGKSTEKYQKEKKLWKNDVQSNYYNDVLSYYFPSNSTEIARGRSFIKAMENEDVVDDNEFLDRDVCLLVHTVPYNPAFVVYPLSDLTEGNYWGILGEHTTIQINVISADGSDLRPMTARGWGAVLLGTIIASSEKDKQVSLLVSSKNCRITDQ